MTIADILQRRDAGELLRAWLRDPELFAAALIGQEPAGLRFAAEVFKEYAGRVALSTVVGIS